MRLWFLLFGCRRIPSKLCRAERYKNINKTFFFSYTAALFLQRLHLLHVLSALYNIAKKTNFVKQICVLTKSQDFFVEMGQLRLCCRRVFCENRTIFLGLSRRNDWLGNILKDDDSTKQNSSADFCKRAVLFANLK